MTDKKPLGGARVITIGGALAGWQATMLLADQGVDAIDERRYERSPYTVDPLLDRGKCIVTPVRQLWPAPWPGAHNREVLAEAGYTAAEFDDLYTCGAVRDGWPVMEAYLHS